MAFCVKVENSSNGKAVDLSWLLQKVLTVRCIQGFLAARAKFPLGAHPRKANKVILYSFYSVFVAPQSPGQIAPVSPFAPLGIPGCI